MLPFLYQLIYKHYGIKQHPLNYEDEILIFTTILRSYVNQLLGQYGKSLSANILRHLLVMARTTFSQDEFEARVHQKIEQIPEESTSICPLGKRGSRLIDYSIIPVEAQKLEFTEVSRLMSLDFKPQFLTWAVDSTENGAKRFFQIPHHLGKIVLEQGIERDEILHEVLVQPFLKLFGDVDFKRNELDEEEWETANAQSVSELINAVQELLGQETQVAILISANQEKFGFHWIVQRWKASLANCQEFRNQLLKKLSQVNSYWTDRALDNLYTSNHCFRLPWTTKKGRTLTLLEGDYTFQELVVSWLTNAEQTYDPHPDRSLRGLLKNGKTVKRTITAQKPPVPLIKEDSVEYEEIESLIDRLSPTRAKDYRNWSKVGWVLKSLTSELNQDLLPLFDKFSRKCPEVYGGVSEFWKQRMGSPATNPLTILKRWADYDSAQPKKVSRRRQRNAQLLAEN